MSEQTKEPALLHEMNPPSPWQPERDALRLAVLGKLAEELNEAGAIVARCIIQGIDECEPVTKKPNREALTNELADVRATMAMAMDLFDLCPTAVTVREARKKQHLRAWHRMISAPSLPETIQPSAEGTKSTTTMRDDPRDADAQQ